MLFHGQLCLTLLSRVYVHAFRFCFYKTPESLSLHAMLPTLHDYLEEVHIKHRKWPIFISP